METLTNAKKTIINALAIAVIVMSGAFMFQTQNVKADHTTEKLATCESTLGSSCECTSNSCSAGFFSCECG